MWTARRISAIVERRGRLMSFTTVSRMGNAARSVSRPSSSTRSASMKPGAGNAATRRILLT